MVCDTLYCTAGCLVRGGPSLMPSYWQRLPVEQRLMRYARLQRLVIHIFVASQLFLQNKTHFVAYSYVVCDRVCFPSPPRPLPSPGQVTQVIMYRSRQPLDLSSLQRCPSLCSLSLTKCGVTSLTGLEQCPQLISLTMHVRHNLYTGAYICETQYTY